VYFNTLCPSLARTSQEALSCPSQRGNAHKAVHSNSAADYTPEIYGSVFRKTKIPLGILTLSVFFAVKR
jgi:hypothetical protein